VPKYWKNGIIQRLPKKGDPRLCTNWMGISLLSIPGKVMAIVLLNRMRSSIDEGAALGFAGSGGNFSGNIFPEKLHH